MYLTSKLVFLSVLLANVYASPSVLCNLKVLLVP